MHNNLGIDNFSKNTFLKWSRYSFFWTMMYAFYIETQLYFENGKIFKPSKHQFSWNYCLLKISEPVGREIDDFSWKKTIYTLKFRLKNQGSKNLN